MLWLSMLWRNPLVRNIALGIAGSLAIFWCIRWYGNAQWQKGEQAGRISATTELEEQYRERWSRTAKDIASSAVITAQDRAKVEAQALSLAASRKSLQASLDASLSTIHKANEAANAKVLTVPDSAIDESIRILSAELAAAH